MYCEGCSKAEVLLVDLCQRNEITDELFAAARLVASEKFMGVLDAVNGRWGRGRRGWQVFPLRALRLLSRLERKLARLKHSRSTTSPLFGCATQSCKSGPHSAIYIGFCQSRVA